MWYVCSRLCIMHTYTFDRSEGRSTFLTLVLCWLLFQWDLWNSMWRITFSELHMSIQVWPWPIFKVTGEWTHEKNYKFTFPVLLLLLFFHSVFALLVLYYYSHPISSTVFGGNALVVKPSLSLCSMLVVSILNRYGYEELKVRTMEWMLTLWQTTLAFM